ncbi:MAG: hypothetical protein OEZ01_18070, partial [Candidatus Heimdallarchaeota archaeon]|nr:hypothetical protein [Candidatus Heimdallarchaeota archaeon]
LHYYSHPISFYLVTVIILSFFFINDSFFIYSGFLLGIINGSASIHRGIHFRNLLNRDLVS